MRTTFSIVSLLLLASCVPPPSARRSFTYEDGIALESKALVDGWFDEIATTEPTSAEALSLAAWSRRYSSLATQGYDASQLHDATQDVRQEFASVLVAKRYPSQVVLQAVQYAGARIAHANKASN